MLDYWSLLQYVAIWISTQCNNDQQWTHSQQRRNETTVQVAFHLCQETFRSQQRWFLTKFRHILATYPLVMLDPVFATYLLLNDSWFLTKLWPNLNHSWSGRGWPRIWYVSIVPHVGSLWCFMAILRTHSGPTKQQKQLDEMIGKLMGNRIKWLKNSVQSIPTPASQETFEIHQVDMPLPQHVQTCVTCSENPSFQTCSTYVCNLLDLFDMHINSIDQHRLAWDHPWV